MVIMSGGGCGELVVGSTEPALAAQADLVEYTDVKSSSGSFSTSSRSMDIVQDGRVFAPF